MAKKAAKKARAPRASVFIPPAIDIGKKVPVDIKSTKEAESIFTLSDGTKLHAKVLLVSVERSKDKFQPSGEPVYQVAGGIVLRAKIPKSLTRKVKP